jgi:hypothetical protein
MLIYGIVGLVLLLGTAFAGLGLAERAERLVASTEATLAAAARSTEAAAAAMADIDGSLTEAQVSAAAAATLARDASTTLASLGSAMQVSIFGAQPLLPLADDFMQSSDQAAALGDTLDGVEGSLVDTRAGVAGIGSELEELADEIEGVRGAAGADGDSPPIRLFVILLLAWLLVPAVGAVIGGITLLRMPRESEAVGL